MITRMAPAVHTSALPERTPSLLLSDIPQVACGMTESSPIEGYAGAQNNLGTMYDNGYGVPQDNILEHMWNNISSARGDELAGENRDTIAKRMTQEAIEEAQAMARECVRRNYQNCGD